MADRGFGGEPKPHFSFEMRGDFGLRFLDFFWSCLVRGRVTLILTIYGR